MKFNELYESVMEEGVSDMLKKLGAKLKKTFTKKSKKPKDVSNASNVSNDVKSTEDVELYEKARDLLWNQAISRNKMLHVNVSGNENNIIPEPKSNYSKEKAKFDKVFDKYLNMYGIDIWQKVALAMLGGVAFNAIDKSNPNFMGKEWLEKKGR